MSTRDVKARYGGGCKLLQSWCRIYRKQVETGLRPKRKGRPPSAKNKPKQELTPMEKMQLCIKELEAENAILKQLAFLEG